MATVTRTIGPADHGRPIAFSDFIDADFEDGWLYELARGAIVVTEVPGPSHGRIVLRLSRLFTFYDRDHPGIIEYQAGGMECRIRLPGMSCDRHPDQAVYVTPEPEGPRPWTRWCPGLVVEVVSEGGEDRDYIEKAEEYLRCGVVEYWVLDPSRREMRVHLRAGDTWEITTVPADTIHRAYILPGLEVRPADLLGPATVQ
jgi:Uma2 family endonuclease